MITIFLFKVLTGLITARTRSTLYPAKDNFFTDIYFTTLVMMNTEVLFVHKAALVIPV